MEQQKMQQPLQHFDGLELMKHIRAGVLLFLSGGDEQTVAGTAFLSAKFQGTIGPAQSARIAGSDAGVLNRAVTMKAAWNTTKIILSKSGLCTCD